VNVKRDKRNYQKARENTNLNMKNIQKQEHKNVRSQYATSLTLIMCTSCFTIANAITMMFIHDTGSTTWLHSMVTDSTHTRYVY